MRRAHRPVIVQRRRVFLGCEGQSEQSYGKRLEALLNDPAPRFHIDTVLLQPGAGDPPALIMAALDAMCRKEEQRGAYDHRAILLDADKRGVAPDRAKQAEAAAREQNVLLAWQELCHEALLLRHLADGHTRRPQTADDAHAALLRLWSAYRKPMSAASLSTHIDRAAILRAVVVEAGLHDFLRRIGFIAS